MTAYRENARPADEARPARTWSVLMGKLARYRVVPPAVLLVATPLVAGYALDRTAKTSELHDCITASAVICLALTLAWLAREMYSIDKEEK